MAKWGNMKINNAELWSIHKGLLLAKDKNWENLIVKTDFKIAMDLIGKNEELEHHMSHIIKEYPI